MSFYVFASNIHTDETYRYGPFPGTPGLTYEFMRCYAGMEDNNPLDGEHIFTFEENWKDAHFHRMQEDPQEAAIYGWRRCVTDIPPGQFGTGQFGIGIGPIWTDLDIEFTEDPPIRTNFILDLQTEVPILPCPEGYEHDHP